MFNKTKAPNLIAIDIGSSKTSAAAIYINMKEQPELMFSYLQKSDGIKGSIITNLNKLENNILKTIYAVEKNCKTNIREVSISIAGGRSYYIEDSVLIKKNTEIKKHDLENLISQMLSNFNIQNYEVIHCFPIQYIIDGKEVEDPIGMLGKTIKCQLHIIAVNLHFLMNMNNCFGAHGINIKEIILSSYASAISCLTSEEKKTGAILIEIGGYVSSISVFWRNKLIFTDFIEIGGEHLTKRIMQIFNLQESDADKLKILYGNDLTFPLQRHKFSFDEMSSNRDYLYLNAVDFRELKIVIENHLNLVFTNLKASYDKLNINHLGINQLILTGGSSLLYQVKEIAHKVFFKPVRVAKHEDFASITGDNNVNIYSTLLGIIQNHLQKKGEANTSYNVYDHKIGYFKKALKWFKDSI